MLIYRILTMRIYAKNSFITSGCLFVSVNRYTAWNAVLYRCISWFYISRRCNIFFPRRQFLRIAKAIVFRRRISKHFVLSICYCCVICKIFVVSIRNHSPFIDLLQDFGLRLSVVSMSESLHQRRMRI